MLLFTLARLAFFSSALAAPLNPWGSATAPGTALVNPYLYLYPDAVNPVIYVAVGLSSRADVYVGVGELLPAEGVATGTLEVFPRLFVDPSVALAAHLYWTPGVEGVVVAPEVHVNHTWGAFALTANAGWRPVLGTSGATLGTVPVIVAPELRLGTRFSAYVEADPTFSLVDAPVGLLVVPGFSATLDAEGHHSVTVGLQVPVLPDRGPASLGAAYCFTFAAPALEHTP